MMECTMPNGNESTSRLLLSFACPIEWDAMEGAGKVRNCSQCNCKVQDISDLSKEQVDEVLAQVDAGEQICIAFRAPKRMPQRQAPLIRISIALAASISLAYLTPVTLQPGLAQSLQRAPKPNKEQASCPPKSSPATWLGQNDRLKLADEEHGLWAGRPAPNAIRELLTEIEYDRQEGANLLTKNAAEELKAEEERGWISPSHVENLAQLCELSGSVSRARKCYSLLIALGPRVQSKTSKLEIYRAKVRVLGEKEFPLKLKQFSMALFLNQSYEALNALTAANEIRGLDPLLTKKLGWSDIQTGMDKLAPLLTKSEDYISPEIALKLAATEEHTPELEHWKQTQRDLAVQQFGEQIKLADSALSHNQDEEGLKHARKALRLGSIDPYIIKRCNWTALQNCFKAPYKHGAPGLSASDCAWGSQAIETIKKTGKRPWVEE
jgi:hypothetical protein